MFNYFQLDQAVKNIRKLGENTFKALEQIEKNLEKRSEEACKEPDMFTDLNSESNILRNKITSASKKIDLIVQ